MIMRTPFAFDIVENSMRIMVDDDDAHQSGLPQRSTKGTPELVIRLWHGYTSVLGLTLPFTPHVLSTMNPFMRESPKAP